MTDKETAPAFTEDLSKQALIDHLRDIHGFSHLNGKQLLDAKRTSITKADMVQIHDKHHETLDKPDNQVRVSDGRVFDGTTRYGIPIPEILHVHEAVTLRPDVAEALEGIRSGTNPLAGSRLSAGERSALTRVIDNDYAALKADLQQLAQQALANDLAQLELDWADRRAKVPTWMARVHTLAGEVKREIELLKEQATADGIELTFPNLERGFEVRAATTGYDKARRETTDANRKSLDSALLKLERERLRAQRQVLLTGITPEAQKILDGIPDAAKMLGEAMSREAAAAQLTGTASTGA
jgi:hypothetical protein